MRTRPFALLALAGLVLSCETSAVGRPYRSNDLQLITAYTAKEFCSCYFVMEQSEAWCRAWTKADPDVTSVRVDTQARTVEAWALLFWGARARLVDARTGCVLE